MMENKQPPVPGLSRVAQLGRDIQDREMNPHKAHNLLALSTYLRENNIPIPDGKHMTVTTEKCVQGQPDDFNLAACFKDKIEENEANHQMLRDYWAEQNKAATHRQREEEEAAKMWEWERLEKDRLNRERWDSYGAVVPPGRSLFDANKKILKTEEEISAFKH